MCRKCERWNLTPLEERWEAIEECERWYRDSRRRVATDNIGLIRLRDGTDLVRIGAPQRPEMAAWRYGDQFGRRQRRYLAAMAGAAAVGGGILVGEALLTVAFGGVVVLSAASTLLVKEFGRYHRVAQVRLPGGTVAPVTAWNLTSLLLAPEDDGGWALTVVHRPGEATARRFSLSLALINGPLPEYRRTRAAESTTLHGRDALNALSLLLPRVNRAGAGRRRVRDAVDLLDRDGDADALLSRIGTDRPWSHTGRDSSLAAIHPSYRLALEMALHETEERRALEGELALLEERWRDAEEIAAISDSLLLPEEIGERVKKLKDG